MSAPEDDLELDELEETPAATEPEPAPEPTATTEVMADEFVDLTPPAGFIRVHHPDLEGTALIPQDALPIHAARGWEPTDPSPQED